MHELTSIAFSHYVEKARWALERFGVSYTDHRYLPFVHFAAVYRLHGGKHGRVDKASTRFSTPVLKTPEGQLVCDSADILHYVSERFAPPGFDLYPTPEVAAVERKLHDDLGPHTRRAAYGACFADPSILRDLARHNVGPIQSGLFVAALPLGIGGLRKALNIDDRAVARSVERIKREFDTVSSVLADGRRYLVGERFTAADLAFACMAAPVIFPPEYSAWMPPLERLPRFARELTEEMRTTRAGAHALRMFREERHRVLV
ncbi:MAG: glutathione S-transferase family protein [Myxococcales bacterium]